MCPRIKTTGGKLRAKSSWLASLACLGLYSCEVVVDAQRSLVTVIRRFFWFVKTKRELPFTDIHGVAYDYQGPRSAVARWLTDDPEDCFSVGLRLHNQAYIHPFSFCGSRPGTPEEESKAFASQLAKLIGVSVGR